MVTKRKAISKKTRFDVFKRDGFKCMYCGNHPPAVLLQVDHIKPVADGGGNEDSNLVTSCQPCNIGKGAGLLSNVPEGLAEKALAVAEREDQIKGYQKVMQSKRLRLDKEAWSVMHILTDENTVSKDWMNSLRMFIDRIGLYEITEAMEIATAKGFRSDQKTWTYFCGICWNKIRKAEDGTR